MKFIWLCFASVAQPPPSGSYLWFSPRSVNVHVIELANKHPASAPWIFIFHIYYIYIYILFFFLLSSCHAKQILPQNLSKTRLVAFFWPAAGTLSTFSATFAKPFAREAAGNNPNFGCWALDGWRNDEVLETKGFTKWGSPGCEVVMISYRQNT